MNETPIAVAQPVTAAKIRPQEVPLTAAQLYAVFDPRRASIFDSGDDDNVSLD